uniref:DUF4477 domain-containing protein n=1 Tax=Parastrongyloides trichosuri TaxID=131310 RepID=A0A0N4ZQ93_PARTI
MEKINFKEISLCFTKLSNTLELMERVIYKGNNSFRHMKFFDAFKQTYRQVNKNFIKSNLCQRTGMALKQIPSENYNDIHPRSKAKLKNMLRDIENIVEIHERIKKGPMCRMVKEATLILSVQHHVAFCQIALGVMGEINKGSSDIIILLKNCQVIISDVLSY